MNLIFLGPPGAGKGTQAKIICQEFGYTYLGTGDLLRSLVSRSDPLALKAKEFMEKGELVPDSLMVEIVSGQLKTLKNGFILDGFPRTLEQAQILEEMLKELGIQIDHVIYFHLDDAEAENRLSNRYQCKNCGNIYNSNLGQCPKCGGSLFRRKDDEPETIRKRLEVYHLQTAPLLEYYERRGKLKRIDAQGSVEEISGRIKSILRNGKN
ncbi:MAG: adenylate kinase [Caldiserica bacterium]|jgi:adenylate kinase|nr:adenylate kinase [Caldisericota bacterium]MDH7563142.1 adenylate kinase [Caldisericota bacterium]